MEDDVHEFVVKQVNGHWEVYINGKFFCTADSYFEAIREVNKTLK